MLYCIESHEIPKAHRSTRREKEFYTRILIYSITTLYIKKLLHSSTIRKNHIEFTCTYETIQHKKTTSLSYSIPSNEAHSQPTT